MIIGYFYVVGTLSVPPEADSVLIVYSDAVLADSVAF